jgi:hypothetical protein
MVHENSNVHTALLPNGDVLIFGDKYPSYASEFYNPFTNTWAAAGTENSITFGPLALLGTGRVLLAGGGTTYKGNTATCLLYDPSTNTWSLTGSLKHAGGHTLTLLQNGQALAVGGSDAELYTP